MIMSKYFILISDRTGCALVFKFHYTMSNENGARFHEAAPRITHIR